MLLNNAFALPAFKKAATPATFPSLACWHSSSGYLSSH